MPVVAELLETAGALGDASGDALRHGAGTMLEASDWLRGAPGDQGRGHPRLELPPAGEATEGRRTPYLVEVAGSTKVLIIDDDVIVREALAIALEGHGCTVVAATDLSPEGILAAAATAEPDVVLLDHYLGGSFGRDLIRPLVRATGATVLLLTSSDDPEVLGTSLEEGAAGTLLKRQPMRDLLDSIVLAAAGHAVQRPVERDGLIASAQAAREERERQLAPFTELSRREASVLHGLMEGLSAEQIAERDFVSLPTVRTQIQAVLRKLGVGTQLAAVAEARRAGWRLDG